MKGFIQRRARVLAVAAWQWGVVVACVAGDMPVIHVHPMGEDGATGQHASPALFRARGPVATLRMALERARAMRSNTTSERVVIRLAPGRHHLAATLRLGPEDSNTTIEGAAGAMPTVLSGGVEVHGWTRSPGRSGAWEAIVPEVASGALQAEHLHVDGRRMVRARMPNEDPFHAAGRCRRASRRSFPSSPGTWSRDGPTTPTRAWWCG